jgi:replicative DNA helicase
MAKQGRKDSTSLRTSRTDKLLPRDLSETLGKLPPQAQDMEEAVLGAVMLERGALLEIVDFLKPEHFYKEAHREIYEACVDLFRASNPVDMRTVYSQLRKSGKAELVGGVHTLAELTSRVSSAANIEYHSRVIIEMALKRELITLASGIHNDAYADETDVFELLGFIDLELEQISQGNLTATGEKHVKEYSIQSINNLQGRMQGQASGVICEFDAVDKITHGWQNSDLIILAARPGMAKSVALGQMLYNIAKRGEPVGIFSIEMPGIQLVDRLAIGLSEVDPDKIRTGNVTDMELKRFTDAQGRISSVPMYIDDTGGINILELRAKARRMWKKHKIVALGVDYIQLINGLGNVSKMAGMNRDQEIGVITRTLKAIAKELNIPVIAISALSRGVETRGGDKRPQLSDLRESGNIESDADIVCFLYRPEYYHITVDEDGMSTHGKTEFIFAKHRNGSLGTALQKFIGKYTKFTSWNLTVSGTLSLNINPKGNFDASVYKDVLPPEREQPPPPNDDSTPF